MGVGRVQFQLPQDRYVCQKHQSMALKILCLFKGVGNSIIF